VRLLERGRFGAIPTTFGLTLVRHVGLTLHSRAGINPAAQALIDILREVGGEFSR
jgi:hypothetical protein